MEPIAPFAKVAEWGSVPMIVAAVILGLAFGFVLERAGFADAKTLAGQWYGYNFAVFRVMFTAIVVAMLGLFGLSAVGFIDLGRVQLNETYLLPQIVGGLVFGAGFAIGQYCPGTAVVAVGTGRVDALSFLGGFVVGVLGWFLAYPKLAAFYGSTSLGKVMLPETLHLPVGVVLVGVVLLALGGFALTHRIDQKLGNKPQGA